jgi:hypothetical protein
MPDYIISAKIDKLIYYMILKKGRKCLGNFVSEMEKLFKATV